MILLTQVHIDLCRLIRPGKWVSILCICSLPILLPPGSDPPIHTLPGLLAELGALFCGAFTPTSWIGPRWWSAPGFSSVLPMLFNIYMVWRFWVRYHYYVEYTQLRLSFLARVQDGCWGRQVLPGGDGDIDDANKLRLNPDKTEVLLVQKFTMQVLELNGLHSPWTSRTTAWGYTWICNRTCPLV